MVRLDFEGVQEFLRFSLGLQDILRDGEQAHMKMVKTAVLEGDNFKSNYLVFLDVARDNGHYRFSRSGELSGTASVDAITLSDEREGGKLIMTFQCLPSDGFAEFLRKMYIALSDCEKRIVIRHSEKAEYEERRIELIEFPDVQEIITGDKPYDGFNSITMLNSDEGSVQFSPSNFITAQEKDYFDCYQCSVLLETERNKVFYAGHLVDENVYVPPYKPES